MPPASKVRGRVGCSWGSPYSFVLATTLQGGIPKKAVPPKVISQVTMELPLLRRNCFLRNHKDTIQMYKTSNLDFKTSSWLIHTSPDFLKSQGTFFPLPDYSGSPRWKHRAELCRSRWWRWALLVSMLFPEQQPRLRLASLFGSSADGGLPQCHLACGGSGSGTPVCQ